MVPLNDRVLIRRIDEPEQRIGSIIVPDVATKKAIKGEVLAVGPGKWHPGEFWKVKQKPDSSFDINVDRAALKKAGEWREWEWIEGWLERPNVTVGQIVYFNSKWDDSNGQLATDLHLVQEADIFVVTH